jgi:adenine phosphoribosyltransferase
LPDAALRSDLASCLDGERGAECTWSVLRDGRLFARAVDELSDPFRGTRGLTVAAGPRESALLLGAAVAIWLDAGFAAIRRAGARLAGPKLRRVAGPDVTGLSEVLVLQVGTVRSGDRVLLVHEWLGDGEALRACAGLVESAGGEVAGVLLLVDALGGEDLDGMGEVHALVRADDCL